MIIPAMKRRILFGLLGCALFTALGCWMISIGIRDWDQVRRPVALIVGGLLGVAVFGVWFGSGFLRQLFGSRRLVVTPSGFTEERRRPAGRWRTVWTIDWSEIIDLFTMQAGRHWPFPGTEVLCYTMTPAAASRAQAAYRGAWTSRLAARFSPPGIGSLPTSYGSAADLLLVLRAGHQAAGSGPEA